MTCGASRKAAPHPWHWKECMATGLRCPWAVAIAKRKSRCAGSSESNWSANVSLREQCSQYREFPSGAKIMRAPQLGQAKRPALDDCTPESCAGRRSASTICSGLSLPSRIISARRAWALLRSQARTVSSSFRFSTGSVAISLNKKLALARVSSSSTTSRARSR